MIVTELHFTTDLDAGLQLSPLKAALMAGDQEAHRLVIHVCRRSTQAEVDLSQAGVTAYFQRADGETVLIAGTVEDNCACVTLPAACYAAAGAFSLVVKLRRADTVDSVLWCQDQVHPTQTDMVVDPGSVLPSLDALLSQIDALETATDAAGSIVACNEEAAARAAQSAQEAAQSAGAAQTQAEAAASQAASAQSVAAAAAQSASEAADSAASASVSASEALASAQRAEQAASGGGIVEEADPTVPAWAKQPEKPVYTAEEVGALPADTILPEAYALPTASASVKGGVMVGGGLQMVGELLSVQSPIVMTTEDPGDGAAVDYPEGTVILVYG